MGTINKMCESLHLLSNRLERFDYRFDGARIPENGIYLIFEKGETAHGVDRIVRIGTHTGEGKLRSRLSEHFIKENKDRSIFRKNVGLALLNKQKNPSISQWEIDLTTKMARERFKNKIDLDNQKQTERMVSKFMQENFSFAVFEVNGEKQRLSLESKIISTVSLCTENKPSKDWLGFYSPKQKIRESGLWLVNELYKEPINEEDLKELKRLMKLA